MASYAKIGALQLVHVTPNAQAVTLFAGECDFHLAALFDITHLISDMDVLKSMRYINTHIHPIKFQLWTTGSKIYEGKSDERKNQVFWFPPGKQTQDVQRGLVVPCVVSVPRTIWPARVGDAVQLRIRATATVDFIHCGEGNRIESVTREADTALTVYCRV